jgi:signal transduction histidine kinase
VLVVVGLWLMMSLATTFYLWWVEASYDHVFTENLTSIRAASTLESIAWRAIAEWDDQSLDADDFATRWTARTSELRDVVLGISLSVHSDEERVVEEQLRQAVDQIGDAIDSEITVIRTTQRRSEESRRDLRVQVQTLAEAAARLRSINDQFVNTARSRLSGAHSQVLITRMVMLLFGPLIGIYLGWRAARKLQSTVSELSDTLRDLDSTAPISGTESLGIRDNTFDDVRRQAERVVERLRQVGLELQSARKEVIQSERLAAVGELAAGVAHELRNPLTSVKLLLQHASRRPEAFRIEESQLKLILGEVARMESTIQGLLDFSRQPALQCIRHDLRATLRRSINLIEGRLQRDQIQLLTAISSEPLWVEGDAEQLNQVFVNLLLNAIEAMHAGGQLRLTAELCRSDRIVRVVVQDTGSGIAPEVLSRLFEPFATTKVRGTGLGLAISRRIVTEHCGTIAAKNQPAQGAAFTVDLPLIITNGCSGK